MEDAVKRFIAVIPGYGLTFSESSGGYGSGSGSGSGDQYGSGFGCGTSPANGGGAGTQAGFGFGFGNGAGGGDSYLSFSGGGDTREIKTIDGREVHDIDGVPTIIYSVHRVRGFYYAKGAILSRDLTLFPCFIARVGDSFAHGDTLRDAVRDAHEKWMDDQPLEDKLDEFVKAHPDPDKEYGDLFDWHHTLTGSCEAGRREWCRAHGYEPTDSITIRTFIEQTRNDYGGEAIRELAQRYNIKLD